jgi:Catalytic LigB subunit of aromatic ring-opening dioxygenase
VAKLVLGMGTSHTPMLNAPPTDWPRFIERDTQRANLLDIDGNLTSYEAQLKRAPADIAAQIAPERMATRHAAVEAAMSRLGDYLREAKLDTLIVVGDDQKELYQTDNLPSMLVYHGKSIRNVPLAANHPGPDWSRAAAARYYERETPREYPVDSELALHVIGHLVEREFDVSVADTIADGYGEGHAFGFVHNRLLEGATVPVLPIFLNTYYPPNQPTPRRCHRLGQEIRRAVESLPRDARVGVIASGGLSHFTVDEELDGRVIRALRERDAEALHALPRRQLNSGNSEIRNWICMAGAVEHLALSSLEYIPAYRTPAGTGTGLCFAIWH